MRRCVLIFLAVLLNLSLQAQQIPLVDGPYAPVAGNALEIISDGPYMLDRLLEDLRGAQESIELEFYWIKADKAGRQVREVLMERLSAGVPVRVIVDNVTAPIEPVAFYDKLRKAGAQLHFWTDPNKRIWTIIGEIGVRDHRKIAVIDHRICYTGGMNLSNDIYRWADTQIRLEGPVAVDFLRLFEEHWTLVSGTPAPETWPAPAAPAGTSPALPARRNTG